jgi:DNA replication and repair protein RecF
LIVNKLQINNFRNVGEAELEADPTLNVIHGPNGAGKTSLVEALVVLARGRSFRTTQAAELIGPNGPTFQLFALAEDRRGRHWHLGLERSAKRWRGRLNGQDLSQLSELTRTLPVVLLEPDSHLLVGGPPDIRRKYMDWAMFHVEHGFLDTWRRYAKALRQRNAALRSKRGGVLESLDELLCRYGEHLSQARAAYAAEIAGRLPEMVSALGGGMEPLTVHYRQGWSEGSLQQALDRNRERDLERGITHAGPHRADLSLMAGSSPARAVLSRGEHKMTAVALLLTQAVLVAEAGETPLILMDDLASELDRKRFARALEQASAIGGQLWLTGTEYPGLQQSHRRFHVEQGQVRRVV